MEDNNDDEKRYLQRDFSIGSDRELDDLRNLDTSHSTLHSPPSAQTDNMFHMKRDKFSRPGETYPPHRSHHDDHLSHSGGFSYGDDTNMEMVGDSQSTPVRKLKNRHSHGGEDDFAPSPPRRELSDAYIEAISRTPRYNSGTSYSEMVDNLQEGDPFGGAYVPSNKPPKKNKKSKKSKSNNELNEDDPKMTDSLRQKIKKRKSKSSKHASSSRDSTGTFTVEGITNMSMSHELGSTGTYTINGADPPSSDNPPGTTHNSLAVNGEKSVLRRSYRQRKAHNSKGLELVCVKYYIFTNIVYINM